VELFWNVTFYLWIAYMIGSIPTAVWMGKAFHGIDVREHGSGNAGATNTMRVLGWRTGLPVLLIDGIKGWLAITLTAWTGLYQPGSDAMLNFQLSVGIMAVVGHVYPLFAGFRGGKGVATLFGIVIALYPLAFLLVACIFGIVLITSRFVSLSSILAALAFPFIVVFVSLIQTPSLVIFAILIAVFIPVTHRKNILRLIHGKESRIILKKG
jgi:acyl phosphate:glycerol-3-phosphate acyltransferase